MVLSALVSLFAPALCPACGDDARGVDGLCQGCRRELRWLSPELFDAGGVRAWAPLAYDGPAGAMARAMKYRGAARLAGPMAAAMAANAPPGLLRGALVPVPLHPARRRRRGFNQAERLAAELGRRSRLPVADCLARRGPRASQVGRDRRDRGEALAGAIGIRQAARPPPRALLVDDVVTTGATLAACAAALRSAGARQVMAIAYARTPGR